MFIVVYGCCFKVVFSRLLVNFVITGSAIVKQNRFKQKHERQFVVGKVRCQCYRNINFSDKIFIDAGYVNSHALILSLIIHP